MPARELHGRPCARAGANQPVDPDAVDIVFVINDHGRLTGSVPLSRLLEASPNARLQDIESIGCRTLNIDADFEEIARLITDFDLLAAPVIDDHSRITGVITADDVLELMMPERWRRQFRPPPEPPSDA